MVIRLFAGDCEPEIIRKQQSAVEVVFSLAHDPEMVIDWVEANLRPEEIRDFMNLWSDDEANREFSIADNCLYITASR